MVSEESIFNTLKLFTFPRLSGTDSEQKAFDLASNRLKNLGIHPSVQEFRFSTFFSRIYPKILFFLGTLTTTLLFFFINVPGIIILVLFNLSLVLILVFLMRKPEHVRFYKCLDSANLFTKLSSKRTVEKMNVFFICHLDSKSQKYIISTRIKAIRRYLFSLIVISVMIVVRFFLSGLFLLIFTIIGALPIIFNAIHAGIILLNTTNNDSPGAVDNASGIACVLELIKHYIEEENNFNNINAWFLFTGAEETGTMGIRNFYRIIKHLEKDSVLVVNFDAIGKNVTIFDSWYQPDWYLDFYNNLVNRQIINMNPKKITLGSHSDGYYFKKKFYPGVEFGDISAYKFVHSKDDTLNKVDPKLLKSLCEVIIENLRKLDEFHDK